MTERKAPANPFVDAELMEGVANFRPLSGQRFQFYVIRALATPMDEGQFRYCRYAVAVRPSGVGSIPRHSDR